ncbi:hypothetical protein [Amycolatopsis sp. cmx-11-12]|uniref:hypothetical protein n=1 Tax=Amycolatopsis sp. cmx-11-12 TaxID=2785795 RepID=UPI003917193B
MRWLPQRYDANSSSKGFGESSAKQTTRLLADSAAESSLRGNNACSYVPSAASGSPG